MLAAEEIKTFVQYCIKLHSPLKAPTQQKQVFSWFSSSIDFGFLESLIAIDDVQSSSRQDYTTH